MPASLEQYYTREMVLAFPDDGNRYELVYGELLVSPSPALRHQRIVLRLARMLAEYVERHGLGEVLSSPADISWGRAHDVIVQPDIFVVAERDAGGADWTTLRDFHMFVEVLSPSTARYDRFTKRRLYQEMKVPLYWIIDPAGERAEVWTPEATAPVMEANRLEWSPAGHEPFVITLAELFAPLRG